jgi:DNA-binding NtrC family response regulator
LGALVRKGLFRQDLYYRLNVATIRLPPLRERGDDALLLAHHFLTKLSERSRREAPRIEDDAVRMICEYPWPGNVRELEHAMEHAFILARGNAIAADGLPTSVRDSVNGGVRRPANPLDAEIMDMHFAEARRVMLERFSDAYLARVLDLAGGSINDAARRAGLDPSNFRKLLRRLDRDRD